MDFKIFKTEEMPKCERCQQPMFYWSPYQSEYKCDKCISDEASDAVIEKIREQFDKSTYMSNLFNNK